MFEVAPVATSSTSGLARPDMSTDRPRAPPCVIRASTSWPTAVVISADTFISGASVRGEPSRLRTIGPRSRRSSWHAKNRPETTVGSRVGSGHRWSSRGDRRSVRLRVRCRLREGWFVADPRLCWSAGTAAAGAVVQRRCAGPPTCQVTPWGPGAASSGAPRPAGRHRTRRPPSRSAAPVARAAALERAEPPTGFSQRAESYYDVATRTERLDKASSRRLLPPLLTPPPSAPATPRAPTGGRMGGEHPDLAGPHRTTPDDPRSATGAWPQVNSLVTAGFGWCPR